MKQNFEKQFAKISYQGFVDDANNLIADYSIGMGGDAPDMQLASRIACIATSRDGEGMDRLGDIAKLLSAYRTAEVTRADWEVRLSEPA